MHPVHIQLGERRDIWSEYKRTEEKKNRRPRSSRELWRWSEMNNNKVYSIVVPTQCYMLMFWIYNNAEEKIHSFFAFGALVAVRPVICL